MDHQSRIAFIISQAAMLSAEIAMMEAANSQHPDSQPYGEKQFSDCIKSFHYLHHNNCIEYLSDG